MPISTSAGHELKRHVERGKSWASCIRCHRVGPSFPKYFDEHVGPCKPEEDPLSRLRKEFEELEEERSGRSAPENR